MFSIIGIVVVLGAVAGGYLMEHGQLGVLMQPAELLIILGAAIGTLLIANPLPILIKIIHGLIAVLKGSPYTKAYYLETLKMLNDLFMVARKNGMVKLEEDVEDPGKSPVFSKYPQFLRNHHAVHFVGDTLRMAISGGVQPFDLDQMMERDMEVHHHEASVPVSALNTVADALPGLGIVAAVLGVVITMGALGGPPEEINPAVLRIPGSPGVQLLQDERCRRGIPAVPAAGGNRFRERIGAGAGDRVCAAQHSGRSPAVLPRDRNRVQGRWDHGRGGKREGSGLIEGEPIE